MNNQLSIIVVLLVKLFLVSYSQVIYKASQETIASLLLYGLGPGCSKLGLR